MGMAVISQSGEIAPADKLLYALRDATATVESIPFHYQLHRGQENRLGADAIVSMSNAVTGRSPDKERARQLARDHGRYRQTGRPAGEAVHELPWKLPETAIGNSLEVDEAVEALSERAAAGSWKSSEAIGSQMLILGGRRRTEDKARAAPPPGAE